MFDAMKKLIMKRYYATLDEVQQKLDVFYLVDRLTDEDYKTLTNLAKDCYNMDENS
jgi:hypothetical protein